MSETPRVRVGFWVTEIIIVYITLSLFNVINTKHAQCDDYYDSLTLSWGAGFRGQSGRHALMWPGFDSSPVPYVG